MKRFPPEIHESWLDFVDEINDPVYYTTTEGRFLFVNRRFRELLGYTDHELSTLSLLDIVHPDYRAEHEKALEHLRNGLAVTDFETVYVARNTAGIVVHGEIKPRLEQGKILAVRGVFRNITDIRDAEQELRNANDVLQHWISQAKHRTDRIAQIRQMGDLLESCESLEDYRKVITRALPAVLPGLSGAFYEFNTNDNLMELVTAWGEAQQSERVFPIEDCWALRRSRIHVEDTASTLRCRHIGAAAVVSYVCIPLMGYGKLIGLLHLQFPADWQSSAARTLPNETLAHTVADRIAAPLASLKRREKTTPNQSIRDPLTGLFNRNYLDDVLQREMSRAARRNRTIAVLLVDLDHFRSFNTRFGREAGDAALRDISQLLCSHVRGEDLCCRYKGQEFVLILPEAPPPVARSRAEKLCQSAKALDVSYRGRKLTGVTVSIGIASFPENASTPPQLLEAAERALGRAKAAGGDRVA